MWDFLLPIKETVAKEIVNTNIGIIFFENSPQRVKECLLIM